MADAVCAFRIREAARREDAGDLLIELRAVGDDDDGWLLLGRVSAQFERQPEHRQALAGSLGVPDDAAAGARFVRRPDPVHGLVDRDELPVAGQLAGGPAAFDLEDDEVPDDVEKVSSFEETVEEDVLGRGGAPELVFELFGAEWVGLLPLQEEPLRRAHRAVDRALAAGTDEDLRRLEKLRRPLALPARAEFLVAVELLDGLGFPAVAFRGALALDDRERQSVDEDGDVGDDVFLRPEHPVLAGDDPLVVVRVVEVEESDGVALASIAAVLFQRDAVGEGGVEPLVGLGETGRWDLGDRLDGRDDVGLGEPGVQALEGGGEAAGEDGFLEGRAFLFQVFGREVGVAEGFQEFDRGVLGEVEFVPAGGLGGHSASGSGVTRSSPVRRTDMRADFRTLSVLRDRSSESIRASVADR